MMRQGAYYLACALTAVIVCAPAFAQKETTALGSALTFKKACAIDHNRFCSAMSPGTNVDEACLRQTYVSLRLECRRALAVRKSTAYKDLQAARRLP
jgi:hypothetical protein